MRVTRLLEVARPVRDLDRSLGFYTQALGFAQDPAPVAGREPLAWAWDCAPLRLARLRLGGQSLLLAECEATPRPPDNSAEDLRFQHIAIVTADMTGAWQRLAAHGQRAISHGGPQRLPAASGGATAVKFRDPDGHPLELLAFAEDAVPARWQRAGDGLTLGIDHSAITVSDADRSIAFYSGQLGLRQEARQTNRGPEQSRLDGLQAPVVEVVALAPEQPLPHLELLGYRTVRARTGPLSGPRTTTVWSVDAPGDIPSWLADPDGHLHLFLAPAP